MGGKNKVIILVDTGSTCNVIHKNFCIKNGVIVRPSQQQLMDFNGSSSKVIETCNIIMKVGIWESILPFHVVYHGTHPILGYPSLKKLGLGVGCVKDRLVGNDGNVFLCYSIKEKTEKRNNWAGRLEYPHAKCIHSANLRNQGGEGLTHEESLVGSIGSSNSDKPI